MATYSIIESNGPYTKIVVAFGGHEFEQNVILSKPAELQAYADDYEAEYAKLPASSENASGGGQNEQEG
jgi:hypothetical protein